MPTPKQSRHGGSSPRSCSSCGNAIPETSLTDLCVPCQRAIRKRNADPRNFEGQWWKWNSTFFARVHMATGHLDVYSIRDTRAKCLAVHRSRDKVQQEGSRVKKITILPAWRKPDPYTEQAELAAVNTLKRALEREKSKRIAAENDAVMQSLKVELMVQDIQTIRKICENGGTAHDVLKFLDTPNA